MQAVTISNFRKKIKYYFDLVTQSSDVLVVPRNGDDDAIVVLSLKEYNALTETSYLLSTEANKRELIKSIKEDKNDEIVTYDYDK